jgi:Bacterial PH domain
VSSASDGAIWAGKPWIIPSVVGWSVLIVVVAVGVLWLEFFLGVAGVSVVLSLALWTGLILLIVWVVAVARLVLLRATHRYVLRDDGLEIKSGVLTSKSYVVVPTGFADLEVVRSVWGRITGTGDIFLRSQSETERRMVKVRDPLRVAEQIRAVVATPTFRVKRETG